MTDGPTCEPVSLRDAGLAAASRVGGKARALGQMQAAGYPVPDGFVLPGDCAADHPAVATLLRRTATGPVAVRSSGIVEDAAGTSLAGRYRSVLQVAPEALAEAVQTCRAHAAALDPDEPPLPLIVQRMVPARQAGVAFSADPVTGDRDRMVVRATRGLGDRLVGGEVGGEEWVLTGDHRLRRIPGHDGRVLRRHVARQIVALCRSVARETQGPVDIEWAWDGRAVWLLQTRPITGLPPTADWTVSLPGVFHRGFRFGEWIPDPVSRLFDTWALPVIEARLHEIHGVQFGQIAPTPHHVTVNGWYFYSLAWLPVPGLGARRSIGPILRRTLADPRRVAAMLPPTVRFGWPVHEREWREELRPRFQAECAAAAARVESADGVELPALIDSLLVLVGEYFASIAVVAGSAYKLELTLGTYWQRHLRTVSEGGHMVLVQGLVGEDAPVDAPGLESLDWVERLHDPPHPTAARARRHEARRQREDTEAMALSTLRTRRGRRRFLRLLRDVQLLVRAREAQVADLGLPWPTMRRAVLRLGGSLVDRGALVAAEDVFHLTKAELDAALTGRSHGDLAARVRTRRAQREAAKLLVPPQVIGRQPVMLRVLFGQTRRQMGGRPVPGALLVGDPASAGRASGPVTIVRSGHDSASVADGDVIVARLTTPAWTPLLARASAVVTDVGSALAHASITARELGIPAVVGTENATSRLRDGQRVVVDGTRGVVLPER